MHGNPAEREHAGAKAVGNGGRSRDGAEHELGQPVKRGDQFVRVLSRSGPAVLQFLRAWAGLGCRFLHLRATRFGMPTDQICR
jgi:hypothetical protein